MHVPYYLSTVPAGFPSPADDFIESRLDLHQHIVKSPSTTFFMRAGDTVPVDMGIAPGDLLVVDRAKPAKNNSIAIVELDGCLCVRTLAQVHGRLFIRDQGSLLPLGGTNILWGCVSHVIHAIE